VCLQESRKRRRMKKAPASGQAVGRGGRVESVTLRMQEVTKAFQLLHSDQPDSGQQLLDMLEENE